MSIHLIQLLCPQRHCICAMPYPSEQEHGKARTISGGLVYEDRATRFETLEEAMPMLKALEADQLCSRQLFDDLRHSATAWNA